MRHVDDGVLRRLVDEPVAIRDSERAHLAGCSRCRERFEGIRKDALLAQDWLAVTPPTLDTAAALTRVQARAVAGGGRSRRAPFSWSSWRRGRSALVAAAGALALIGAVVFTPAGSLAQDLITVFQPTQVVSVPVTQTDVQILSQLTQYGTFSSSGGGSAQEVSGPDAAATQTGMAVSAPSSLPADVTGTVRYAVMPSQTETFTFDAAKARAAVQASGGALPDMPADMDGSALTVTTGDAVLTVWGGGQGDIPTLVIGQMKRPTITAQGVSVQQLEDYLYSIPGISPQLKDEIKSIQDPSSALPIPIPVDRAYSHPVDVQGVQGLAVGDSTGIGSGVVWQKDGVVYGVAGSLSESEVLSIANGLH